MSRPVLVDSSWYIQRARKGKDPLFELSLVAETRDIATCGMIVAEVGRGLKIPRFLKRYRLAWSEMVWVQSSERIWEHTMEIAWRLDRKGTVLPIQDIHIAACALEISAAVLTFDQHFKLIPGLTVTDCLY
jgi:predicted nucleic acid-binding protein